jgi:4-diphosphocytidyl-2-C-methyl-D-erythritol kinase
VSDTIESRAPVAGTTAIVAAHAKINLRLAVLSRETTGYHTVETIMHRLALADEVRVTLSPPGTREVQCSEDVGPPQENLAYRAAMAYLDATRWETGFAIHITKHIPTRAGLGGGSADAAATLQALRALHLAQATQDRHVPPPCSHPTLVSIAGQLGADVAFLATDAAMALAWGRGDRVLALDPLPERWVALVTPAVGVSTAEAYQWIAMSRAEGTYRPQAMMLHPWQLANWSELAPLVHNDFTAVVAERHPSIARGIEALRSAGAIIAEMSGSGSTVFGIFEREPDREAIEREAGATVIVTRTGTAGLRVEMKD